MQLPGSMSFNVPLTIEARLASQIQNSALGGLNPRMVNLNLMWTLPVFWTGGALGLGMLCVMNMARFKELSTAWQGSRSFSATLRRPAMTFLWQNFRNPGRPPVRENV